MPRAPRPFRFPLRYVGRRVEVRRRADGSLVGLGTIVRAWHWRGAAFVAPNGAEIHPGTVCRVVVHIDRGTDFDISVRYPKPVLHLAWPA